MFYIVYYSFSILYLIHIFEIRTQALNLYTSIFIFLFVDNSLLISQRKMYNTTLPRLYSSYRLDSFIWLDHRVLQAGDFSFFYGTQ